MKTSKILGLLLVCFIAINCPAKTETDADITKALVGTWTDAASDNEPMHSKATYYANGRGVELVWPKGQSVSTAVRIDTTWGVTNSILTIKSINSSNPQRVPAGIEIKDQIVSVSSDQYVFKPIGYADPQKQGTRVRVKEPN